MENYWRTGQLEKNKKTFPNQIVTDKEVIDDPQKICEAFNIHFATVGENIGKSIKSHESSHSLLPNFPNSFFFFLLPLKRFTHLLVM